MKLVKITIAIAACLLIGQSTFANTVTVNLKNGVKIECGHGDRSYKFISGRTVTVTATDSKGKKESISHKLANTYKAGPNKGNSKAFNFIITPVKLDARICVGKHKKCKNGIHKLKNRACSKTITFTKDGNAGKNIKASCT